MTTHRANLSPGVINETEKYEISDEAILFKSFVFNEEISRTTIEDKISYETEIIFTKTFSEIPRYLRSVEKATEYPSKMLFNKKNTVLDSSN